jgi:ribonucleotide reductase alpha subunit
MFSTGRKEVFEVTLANNAKIRMTGNHKVTVGYDISTNTFKDVELKDLKPGDSVCVDYSPIFDAHIGNKAEYEKGIVAGWLLADGCFSKHHHDDDYSVEFCVGEKEFEYASQLEGLVVKHYDDNFQLKPHGQTKAALRGRVFKQSVVTQMKADLGIQGWNKFDNELYKKGKDFKLGVLRAIFTCDGSSSSNRIASLYSIDEKFLAGIQRILMEFGIYSDILINGKAKIYIAKDDKVRNNKTCWALNVHDVEFEKIGFLTEYKNKRMLVNINRKRSSRLVNRAKSMNKVLEHKRELVITSIESVGMHDVYDITVDEVHHYNTNGLVVHNCFEILLRDRGVCNLTEVNMMAFVRPDGSIDKDGLFKAQKLSAKIGYRMATTELEMHEWNLVNQEDMLTGCSITGVMDFVNASGISHEELAALLEEMRQVAKAEVNRLAKFLGTNESKLVTTIKPSGTISQLPTVSSGVHFSHAPYYIRRVRVNSNDPMAKALKKAGFVWHPENNQTLESHTTAVFEIPVKAPKGKTKYDVSAVEQLELYKLVMKHYVDHNASNTVHVRNDEWEQVEEWVYNNWDDVVGLTFLSLDDSFYQLMPYEEITEEKYNELSAALPTFNPTMLKEFESFVEEFDLGSDCEGGACPIR